MRVTLGWQRKKGWEERAGDKVTYQGSLGEPECGCGLRTRSPGGDRGSQRGPGRGGARRLRAVARIGSLTQRTLLEPSCVLSSVPGTRVLQPTGQPGPSLLEHLPA